VGGLVTFACSEQLVVGAAAEVWVAALTTARFALPLQNTGLAAAVREEEEAAAPEKAKKGPSADPAPPPPPPPTPMLLLLLPWRTHEWQARGGYLAQGCTVALAMQAPWDRRERGGTSFFDDERRRRLPGGAELLRCGVKVVDDGGRAS
jgi:hypothetical protein